MKDGAKGTRRAGVTLLVVGMAVVVLVGMMAFAVDLGRMYLDRAQVHVASDAAALAGAARLARGYYLSAADTAVRYGLVNTVENVAPTITTADVQPGIWTRTTGFTPVAQWSDPQANAVRATARFTAAYAFGRIFGLTTRLRSAASIAVVGSVRWTSCVKPFAIQYAALVNQLNTTAPLPSPLKTTADSLTAADLQKIAGFTSAQQIWLQYNLNVAATPSEFAPVRLPNAAESAYNSGAFDDLIAAQCGSPLMLDQHVAPGSLLGQDAGRSMGQVGGGLAGWCDGSGTKGGGNQNVTCPPPPSGPGPMRIALVDPLSGGSYRVRALLGFTMTRFDKNPGRIYGYFTTMPISGPFTPTPGALKRVGLVQ